MGAWSDEALGNDAAVDLWNELVDARDGKTIQKTLDNVLDAYAKFEVAVERGENFIELSPEEIEQRIATAKATPGNDNKHWDEFEEMMRETYAEPIEWEGTREADQVLAASFVVHAIAMRDFAHSAWKDKRAGKLREFSPAPKLLKQVRDTLERIATNPAKRKETKGWAKKVAQARQLLDAVVVAD